MTPETEAGLAPGGSTGAWQGAVSRESLVAGLALLALLLVCFHDVVFLGKTLRVSNTMASVLPTGHYGSSGGIPERLPVLDNTPAVLEEPYQVFKAHWLRRGVFPIWNPHQAGGYPFLAAMESSLLFAAEAVLYSVPQPWGWDAYILFRLWLAGIFTYWLMRALGFERLPAFTGGFAYMLSGPLLSLVTNVTVNADVLLPLLLFLIERILASGQRQNVVLTAFAVFQIVAGGHPEHAFLSLLTGTIYLAFRTAAPERGAERLRRAGQALAGMAAGLGLSAVLLLPLLEYAFREGWHVHSKDVGRESELLFHLVTLVFPGYYSRWIVSQEIAGFQGWNVSTWPGGWLGFSTIWLALYALCARDRSFASYPFLFLLFFYLAKIFGFPLVNWIGILPVLDQVKFQLHAPPQAGLAVSVLAGMAIAYAGRERPGFGRFLLPLALMILAIVALWRFQRPVSESREFLTLPALFTAVVLAGALLRARALIRPAAFAGLLSVVLFAEIVSLVPRERMRRAETFRVPPYVRFLRRDPSVFRVYGIDGCLFPNTATAFGLDDIGMYEGLFVKRFARYVHVLVDPRFFGERSFHAFRAEVADPGSPFLDLLNLKYFILPRGSQIPADRMKALSLRPVYLGEVAILERKRALPRAFIRHHADHVADGEAALRALRSGYDVRRGVLLEGEGSGSLAENPSGEGGSAIEAQDFGVNAKSFRVRMVREGFLVVGDVHYPGWKAEVDGRPVPVARANYLFQAVRVPEGEHRVTLRFDPWSVRAGAAISLVTLAALLLWARAGRGRARSTADR